MSYLTIRGLAAVMDKAGFHLMTGAQTGWMAAILASGGILFPLALGRRMIPGSRPGFPFRSFWHYLVLGSSAESRCSFRGKYPTLLFRRDGRAQLWK